MNVLTGCHGWRDPTTGGVGCHGWRRATGGVEADAGFFFLNGFDTKVDIGSRGCCALAGVSWLIQLRIHYIYMVRAPLARLAGMVAGRYL